MICNLTGVPIKPKILFVDDNLSFIRSVLSFLKLNENFDYAGYAANGEEALQKVRTEKPDVVLMDIQMPGIDGIKATKIIKKEIPSIKIIILTLHEDKEYMDTALSAGADGFITKSRFVDEFYPTINNILVTDFTF